MPGEGAAFSGGSQQTVGVGQGPFLLSNWALKCPRSHHTGDVVFPEELGAI